MTKFIWEKSKRYIRDPGSVVEARDSGLRPPREPVDAAELARATDELLARSEARRQRQIAQKKARLAQGSVDPVSDILLTMSGQGQADEHRIEDLRAKARLEARQEYSAIDEAALDGAGPFTRKTRRRGRR